jgi:hypothetical protein
VKRFQNRIAESRYTLPLMIAYAAGVWVLGGIIEQQWYLQFAALMVSTFLMVELNNTNALLHIYSRMVSASFLALTCTAVFLFPSLRSSLCMLSFILFCTIIFHTYQDKESPGLTYFAFLCLGIASLMFIQVLFFIPFLWLMMRFKLMAFSWRMLWASLLGIITPYWFLIGWAVYTNRFDAFIDHFVSIAHFEPLFQYQHLTLNQLIVFGWVAIVALLGIAHYASQSVLDKIRTRMIYESFIIMTLALIVFAALQPSEIPQLVPIMSISVSPLIAHYITYTNTRLTNLSFVGIVVIVVLTLAYHIWTL